MNNLTKMKILKPANEVFEAFVNPSKIGGFWFSSSSERWEQGKKITVRYDEYNARLDINILQIEVNKKIIFQWGANGEERTVTITFYEPDHMNTLIEVKEEGFKINENDFVIEILDNKEGWVFMLTCLKAYLEFGITQLRSALVKD
ncbi:SRPBCC family protein [Rummeliibacillus sp. NPDC094406]|uniref:SRPBCC family protein n=1 Tax=Rummeliibacillus sp. NPDC094406 TaxID=3364511 RepID=UPI0038082EB1